MSCKQTFIVHTDWRPDLRGNQQSKTRMARRPWDSFHLIFLYITFTHVCMFTRTDIFALVKRHSTPTEERTIKHTKTDLEPVKCEQTDDKTTTDGFTEERRATHSTQLAMSCCMTPMGYGILAWLATCQSRKRATKTSKRWDATS